MYKLKAEDKATFRSLVKIKAPVLVSKNTDERMFVVDSGASMHMLSKKDLSSQTNKEAQVYVYDLELFVTVQSLDEMPAVSIAWYASLKNTGCSYEWKNGETLND